MSGDRQTPAFESSAPTMNTSNDDVTTSDSCVLAADTARAVSMTRSGPSKPPFAYFGGKTTMAPQIAALLPAHRHYVEPFAGSLAVLLAKEPTRFETVNDIDGDLMLFWRVLRDRGDELVRAMALTPHSRGEYLAAHEPTDDEMEKARRVWVIISQGRAGTLRRTGWRYFAKPGYSTMVTTLDAYVARAWQAVERLRAVSLECRPALELIDDYGRHPEVCLYIDAPYEGEGRPNTYDGYRHEMRSTEEHRDLLERVIVARAAVVISGYPTQLYDELLASWCRVEIAAHTTQGNGVGARTEVLWSNRSIDDRQAARLFELGALHG